MINIENYPKLKLIDENKRNKVIDEIFKLGYNLYFNEIEIEEKNEKSFYLKYQEKLEQQLNNINYRLDNQEIKREISLLNETLNKLIGLSNNSSKKGELVEDMIFDYIRNNYKYSLDETRSISHSGDGIIKMEKLVMLEMKNYQKKVNQDEIDKLKDDLVEKKISYGLLLSFNSGFCNYNNFDIIEENYQENKITIILVGNLNDNLFKLDCAIELLKVLFKVKEQNNLNLLITELNETLLEIEPITQDLVKFQNQLIEESNQIYLKLVQYQNKIKRKVIRMIDDYKQIKIENYKDEKMYLLLNQLIERLKKYPLIIEDSNGKIYINYNWKKIGEIVIQKKKIIFKFINPNMESNIDITLTKNSNEIDLIESLINKNYLS